MSQTSAPETIFLNSLGSRYPAMLRSCVAFS